MPSLSPETLKLLDELSREYRIHFYSDIPQDGWPAHHRKTLQHVKELGDKKFDHYAIDPAITEEQPWKITAKALARLLVEKANRCRQRNESTWRFACEPLIFARLSGEVVCRKCRKRLWRSDIEVCRNDESITATALQTRQNARDPCRCSRVMRSQDLCEAVGINPIFGCRTDEEVRFEKPITEKLRKQVQKPDAIYGLRQTRNIENLLHDTQKRQLNQQIQPRQIHELLEPSPFDTLLDKKGDALLFPFLIVEAKSGTSGSDWYSINMQTALPIRTFLQTQDRLRRAHSPQDSHFNPLVWFFSYKGEDWRLSIAYKEERGPGSRTVGTAEFRVVDVWRASISNFNGALQLLLLVDYIFDWARDIYREDIIRNLRAMASGENDAASSVYNDTAILSNLRETTHDPDEEDAAKVQSRANSTSQRVFTSLDSELGAVRHATFIESRFCCVVITEDNWDTVQRSAGENLSRQLLLIIKMYMKRGIAPMTYETLSGIEQRWTGASRPGPFLSTEFCTLMSYSTYISSSWCLVRELYLIAVQKSMVQSYKSEFGGLPITLHPQCSIEMVEELQGGSIGDVLLAAINRLSIDLTARQSTSREYERDSAKSLRAGDTDVDMEDSEGLYLHTDANEATTDTGSGACYHSARHHDTTGQLRNMVQYIYDLFKKPTKDPEEPFLRCSHRLNQQGLSGSNTLPYIVSTQFLQESDDGYVLVHAMASMDDPESNDSDVCVFLTRQPPIIPTVWELQTRIKRAVETRDVYHTTRDNGPATFTTVFSIYNDVPWNLHNTYGVYSYGIEFYIMLEHPLSNEHQARFQGSSRELMPSGHCNLDREFFPWYDYRRNYEYIKSDVIQPFVKFKLLLQEFDYWRKIAEDRRAADIHCCLYCATGHVGPEDICFACSSAVENTSLPDWFKGAIMGKNQQVNSVIVVPDLKFHQLFEGYPNAYDPSKDIPHLVKQVEEYWDWHESTAQVARRDI